ncbi:polysaccharide pyruvyl transferase family protein [Pseudomonas sp. PDM26]|uniref:polysaccharide pyruvyl transferase family protein n=1 Tax=Pseudomonas sp. PDM26 TaxID=2854766 RepID=UPI001C44B975|nr:polysaccharide pyruvyl transferase family protein [Pseudomonas sp. PDM26]MBV7546160.1 polysaccharide pyruvyl transferase family protein [Pseudomonas sp. PDM26]
MPFNRKPLKAYIRGAYGPGNLGDDVLLEVCINILRRHFKEENISVGVKHPNNVGYLNKYKCNYVPISAPIKTDFLFFGGGGQFFEFNGNKTKKPFIQKYLEVRKQGLSQFEILKIFALRALKKSRPLYKRSAAVCLGVGPFETSSPAQIEQAISPLVNCDFRSVRDSVSLEILEKLLHTSAIYTDPTFLLDHWNTETSKPVREKGNSIGVILRDWKLNQHGENVLKNTIEAARQLASRGYTIKLISLYHEHDRSIIDKVPDFEWLVWDPQKCTPGTFIKELQQEFDILVSTRAHGVLLPAQVGLPSVVVGIEPKLKNIHNLLPQGTLFSDGLNPDDIIEKTLIGLNNQSELSQQLLSDVKKQTTVANTFLKDINSWITKSVLELQ